MDFDVEDKQIQKKINWISSQIRETKIQLKRQYKELEEALNAEAEDGSKLRVWQIAVDRNGRRLSQSFRL